MTDPRQVAKEIAEKLSGLTLGEAINILDSVKKYYLDMKIGAKDTPKTIKNVEPKKGAKQPLAK